jgi:hypothetical protein
MYRPAIIRSSAYREAPPFATISNALLKMICLNVSFQITIRSNFFLSSSPIRVQRVCAELKKHLRAACKHFVSIYT